MEYQTALELNPQYEEALRIKPGHALAHNGLGNIYNATGELDKAMEEFKKSLFYDSRYISW